MIKEFQKEYRWLSNFWFCRVQLDGEWYNSVEHAYVAAKTLDLEERKSIQKIENPGVAKRLGRKLTIRPDWDRVKLSIMESLVRQKFKTPYIRKELLATGDEILQEGNLWNDTFWGVDLHTGKGENHIGKILMKIREELKRPREEGGY